MPPPSRTSLCQRLFICCAFGLSLVNLFAAAEKKAFNIPAGTADQSLKQFTSQSGAEVVYPAEIVRGVKTRAVRGEMTPDEAIEQLLAETALAVKRDARSATFMISRGPNGQGAAQATASAPPKKQNDRETNGESLDHKATVELSPFVVSESDNVGYTANSTLAGTRLNTALRDVGASISIITPEFLSDIGATNAGQLLAYTVGTEVGGIEGNFAGGTSSSSRPDQSDARESPQGNQRVRGVGPAATSRDFFLTDIAFDSYNISRVTINRGPNSLLFGIGNPAGVIEASVIKPILSRTKTEITARFGTNDSRRFTIDHNQVVIKDRLAFRFAGKQEKNIYNQEPAFESDRRGFGSIEGIPHKGTPSSIVGRTSLRISGEMGDGHAVPVNVNPPNNAYSIFFSPPNPSIDDLPGVVLSPQVKVGDPGFIWAPGVTLDNRITATLIPQNSIGYYSPALFAQVPLVWDTPGQVTPGYMNTLDPVLTAIAGTMGRVAYTPAANGRGGIEAFAATSLYRNIAGFVTPSLQDRAVFDYRNRLISGSAAQIRSSFNVGTATFSQELFRGTGGFEAAVDRERTRSYRQLPFSFGQNGANNGSGDIYIDVSQYLGNDQPNPNVGRPFILQRGVQDRKQYRERESFRLTAFQQFNFDRDGRKLFGIPLGNHTITGLYTTQDISVLSRNLAVGWDSNTRNASTTVFSGQGLNGFNRAPILLQYIGPSVLGKTSASDLRVTDVFNGRLPQDGDTYNITFYDLAARKLATEPMFIRYFLDGQSRSRQKITSKSLSIKSDFLDNNLVGIVGWRNDRLQTYSSEGNTRFTDGTLDPDSTRLRQNADLDEAVRNFSWSVVGRYPEKWLGDLPWGIDLSAYYNVSGNFNPISVRTNLNGAIIAAPDGETTEHGILLEFLDRRVSLRLNKFETNQGNASNNASGATLSLYNFDTFMLGRYRDAERAGIPFASILGVSDGGYSSYQQLYTALQNILPEPTKTIRNTRLDTNGNWVATGLNGLTDTTNLSAKGFEAELVGNITRSWRVSFNVAKQETVLSNVAPLTKSVADYVFAQLVKSKLLGIDQGPNLPVRQTAAERFASDISAPLSATVAMDGAVSQEQRKWRANFVSTYNLQGFENKYLKRIGVGAAVRWQDKGAIGNYFLTGQRLKQKIVATNSKYTDASQIPDNDPVMQTQFPDLENPIYAPAEMAGDFWITYRQKVTKKINYTLQVNVRNAWGNSDDLPVRANPDGTIALIRIPAETRWYLSNTFSF